MREHDAFLRTIQEDPDNDAPRLVYADFLEEHGDPANVARAEFIRLQVALSRPTEDDLDAPALRRREKALLARYGREWLLPPGAAPRRARGSLPPPGVTAWEFRRGFLECVTIDADRFPRAADELFRHHPLRELRVRKVRGDVGLARAIAASPLLARVEVLRFLPTPFHENGLTDEGLAALAESPHLTRLHTLDLDRQRLTAAGLKALMDSGLVRRLRAFRLAQTRPNPVWPQAVAGDAIGQLWAGRHFPALESLALENTPLTPKQLDLLLAGKFNRLTELSLVHCALRDGGAEVLARAATSLTPRELDLRQNLLGEPAVRALARSELPEHLRALNLSSNRLGNAGVAALVSGRTFFALRQLVLRRNRLGDSAARILGAYPVFPRLRKLDLAYNELSLAGVRRLMKCKSLSFLQFLDVRGNTFHRHEKALLRKKWQATC